MRLLKFPCQVYVQIETNYVLDKSEGIVGALELVWASIYKANPKQPLTRKDHKVIKRLKKKIKDVTVYKDPDQDSRVAIGAIDLYLEEDEYSMLNLLIDANDYVPFICDEYNNLLEIVENAKEVTIENSIGIIPNEQPRDNSISV